MICWIMLNPSKADAEVDDPTIRRCIGFSKAWGAGGICVVNLFPLRATNPDELLRPFSPPVKDIAGVMGINNATIGGLSEKRRIIAAWGSHKAIEKSDRDRQVMRLLDDRTVECLGITKDGYPRHPLYVAGKVTPVEYRGRPR